MKINREGRKIIQGGGLLLLAGNILIALYAMPLILYIFAPASLIFFFFICAFFREPSRPHLKDSTLVYAPADGEVVVCEQVREDEYMDLPRYITTLNKKNYRYHCHWLFRRFVRKSEE